MPEYVQTKDDLEAIERRSFPWAGGGHVTVCESDYKRLVQTARLYLDDWRDPHAGSLPENGMVVLARGCVDVETYCRYPLPQRVVYRDGSWFLLPDLKRRVGVSSWRLIPE